MRLSLYLTWITLWHSTQGLTTMPSSCSSNSKVKVSWLPWVTEASRWKLVFTNTANVWVGCSTLTFARPLCLWLYGRHDGRPWPWSNTPSWRSCGTGRVTSRSYRVIKVVIPLLTLAAGINNTCNQSKIQKVSKNVVFLELNTLVKITVKSWYLHTTNIAWGLFSQSTNWC